MPANRWLMTGIWLLSLVLVAGSAGGQAPARPNFLWISIEDASPDLGCYGDPYSVTPNLDRFAAEGVRFTHAFSNSPVCAPSRSTLITGVYCTTMGTHQMRCQGIPAAGVRCFPEYLREAGYYCTNNVKTDYQFAPPLSAWDESSPRAHWRKRKPGQPFFAVFNFTTTHESQVRLNSPDMHRRLATLRPGERHDPTKAVLPPYYPDTPAVRLDWARYYDLITLVDRQVEEVLRELEADGLKENTIVWFWGDHGRGLSRAKRWVYDSGTRVPLLIRVPEPLRERAAPNRPELCRPGAVRDDLVSFVDFAPTMLALAAIPRPRHMQGRPFLGARDMQGSRYVFAHRDRMDEAYDLIRSVRDQRFRYIRNFRPDLPYSQRIAYMDEMPTMMEWRRLHREGRLTGPPALHFRPTKALEELFDCAEDPHQVRDLAGDPRYRAVLVRMRRALEEWMVRTQDLGLIPEPELDEWRRPGGEWPRAATPQARLTGGGRLQVHSATPGASLVWTLSAGANPSWQLFRDPISVPSGARLRARACRAGWRDSEELVWSGLSELSEAGARPPTEEWWERVRTSDLLPRLRELLKLDFRQPENLDRLLDATRDREPSLRWWAVLRLRYRAAEPSARERARAAVLPLLQDGSPAVRIAAAGAAAAWGESGPALPILLAEMGKRSDSVRLHAAIALSASGVRTPEVEAAFRRGLTDSSEYVKRVSEAARRQSSGAALDRPTRKRRSVQPPGTGYREVRSVRLQAARTGRGGSPSCLRR